MLLFFTHRPPSACSTNARPPAFLSDQPLQQHARVPDAARSVESRAPLTPTRRARVPPTTVPCLLLVLPFSFCLSLFPPPVTAPRRAGTLSSRRRGTAHTWCVLDGHGHAHAGAAGDTGGDAAPHVSVPFLSPHRSDSSGKYSTAGRRQPSEIDCHHQPP